MIARNNGWNVLCYENNIELAHSLDKMNRFVNYDGWTHIFKNHIFIFYKNIKNERRKRFTIAHEFGHIELLHLKGLVNSEFEKEANMFAARILMPLCVLKEIGAFTPKVIADVCKTSLTAASYRAKRLNEKIQLNLFYKSKLELIVKKQFENFIKLKRI